MKPEDHSHYALLGKPQGTVFFDTTRFPDVDCIIPPKSVSFKASEGIRSGDMALIPFTRAAVPGDLVVADTPHDGRRLMRMVIAASPTLQSDDPTIQDVQLDEPSVRIIGTVVDTLRNSLLLRAVDEED